MIYLVRPSGNSSKKTRVISRKLTCIPAKSMKNVPKTFVFNMQNCVCSSCIGIFCTDRIIFFPFKKHKLLYRLYSKISPWAHLANKIFSSEISPWAYF